MRVKVHEMTEHDFYKCGFGDHRSNDKKNLKEHEETEHGIIDCEKCEYSALDKEIMSNHMKTHTGSMLFICRICEFETTREAMLEDHCETKHKPIKKPQSPKHKCEKCELFFEDKFILKSHVCIITSKFQCELCTFTGVTLGELLDHMGADHSVELRKRM